LPKKTVETIIESGNDYVIAVKKNQPTLYNQIEETIMETDPIDRDYTLEKNRGRTEEREVFIYEANLIDKTEWVGVQQVVQVIRRVQHKDGHQSFQEAFYIESTGKTAFYLNQGIRGHWFIENTLHWTKDVVFKEDASTIHMEQAPENMSLIKNWVMAIFRMNNFNSMTRGIRMVANDLKVMVTLLE
jgi:predicted transposase YbfD/YdcC